MIHPNKDLTPTRQRILEAGEKIFALRGFRDATVREICGEAGVNVAAVNYHFGNKKSLYFHVLKYSQTVVLGGCLYSGKMETSQHCEERFRAFLFQFASMVLGRDTGSQFGKLIAMELIEPTSGLETVVEEAIRNTLDMLRSIVADFTGNAANQKAVLACTASIFGQAICFFFSRPLFAEFFADHVTDLPATDTIARHIAEFSLNAVKGLVLRREEGVTPF